MVTSAVDPIRKSGKFDICLISLNEELGDEKKTLHRDIKHVQQALPAGTNPEGEWQKKLHHHHPVNQVESTTFTHPSSGRVSPPVLREWISGRK